MLLLIFVVKLNSKYYVLKHILPKAKSERIKHISNKPYLGYYFDLIDGYHD